MTKKLLCIFIGLGFLAGSLRAQSLSDTYQFTFSNTTYTPIVGTALSYLYNGSANGDDGYATAPIGFTFTYEGVAYTTMNVCANGWASFGAAIPNNTSTWTNNLSTGPSGGTVTRPVLAPLWDDMDNSPGSTQYLTSGSAPNRTFTVQWTNQFWQYDAASACMSYQMILHETTNVIDFVYNALGGTLSFPSASIGISGTLTGAGNFMSLNNASAAPLASTTVSTTNIATKPATGQVYSFVPYCATSTNNHPGTEIISRVRLGSIDNNSGTGSLMYENFTNISTFLQPSSVNPIIINLTGSYSLDHVYVWIDFNHNGSFTDAGELVFDPANGAGPFSGNVTIPAISGTVLLGPTRMRVKLDDTGGSPANSTPCGLSDWGQVEDYTVDIENCSPAAITTQPPNTTICNNGNGTIGLVASGTALTYQWQVSTDGGANFSNISGGVYSGVTTNTLTITGATLAMNNYQYRVIINGTCTPLNTASGAATLTVNSPGAITLNPPATSKVCIGSNISYTVAASGNSPAYQWEVSTDGGTIYSDIVGATSATLTLTAVPLSSNGNRYRAKATIAACGTVTSSATVLTVNALPVVTISAAPGTQVRPTVTTVVSAGSAPAAASYTWTLNGALLPGATTSSVTADVDGIGTYKATITDVNGCVNTTAGLKITSLLTTNVYIYPNPSSGVFHIRLFAPLTTDWRVVRIFDERGNKVAEKEYLLTNVTNPYLDMDFDFSNKPKGLYFISIGHRILGGWTVTGKILVQ